MFLITKDFFKNISDFKLKKKILEKCSDFSKLMIEKEMQIRSLPKGYWVRKINNTDIFKFRLKSGDRILFTYINDNRYKETSILFLDYCTHDKQIIRGKSISLESSILKAKDLQIDKSYLDDEFDSKLENENKFINTYKNKDFIDLESLTSIIVDDSYISLLMNNNNEDYLYYLTQSQFNCIKKIGKPVIITGAAGSGKTTVALHKLLAQSFENSKVCYITYTELLSDNAQRCFEKFRNKKSNNGSVSFYYIHQFYSKTLGIPFDCIATYETFKSKIEQLRFNDYKSLKKVDSLDIYTEYRGILKGYLGLEANQVKTLSSRKNNMLTLEEYLNLPNSYSIFTDEEKVDIYKLCSKYNEKLIELGMKDENDLAIETIFRIGQGSINLFDYVIVDEVQDLSEIQIYMLSKLVKNPNQIMFSGDIHQIINPTFFNFGRLRNIYFGLGFDTSIHTLSKNYRNTIEIIQILNTLIKDRQQYIGKTKYDYVESGITSGDKALIGSLNNLEIQKLLKYVSEKHYCAIVVPNIESKNKLISLYEGSKDRIFLVNEIKGLEYDNIYCLNMLSVNNKEWNEIYNGVANGNSKYRYFFNLFYVAISRARKNLFIYEDNIKNPVIESIKSLTKYQEVFNTDNLKIEAISSKEDWIKESKRLEKVGNLEKAQFARNKSEEELIINSNARMDSSMVMTCLGEVDNKNIVEGNDMVSNLINEGFKYYQNRNYGGALNFYEKALKLDRDNYLIYHYMANCFGYMTGGMKKSLEYYDWCLQLKEDYLEAHLDRAAVAKNIPGYELNAIETLEKGYKYHPNIANICDMLGDLYLELYKSDYLNGKENDIVLNKAIKYYNLGIKSNKALSWDSLNKRWKKDNNNRYLKCLHKSCRENLKLCSSKKLLNSSILNTNYDDYSELFKLFNNIFN